MQDLSLQSLLPATVSVPKMLLPEITFLQLAFMSYNYPPTFVSNVVIDHRQLSEILDLLTKVHLKAIMPFSISSLKSLVKISLWGNRWGLSILGGGAFPQGSTEPPRLIVTRFCQPKLEHISGLPLIEPLRGFLIDQAREG